MALWHFTLLNSERGKALTTSDSSLALEYRMGIGLVRLHYLFLTPWIVLTVPARIFLGLGILLTIVLLVLGLAGTLANRPAFATLASLALVAVLLIGKIGADIAREASPDTAILLTQFVAVIGFMEGTRTIAAFDLENAELGTRNDDESRAIRNKLNTWVRDQLNRKARLVIGALGLSLLLLVLGGFTSISINQLGFSAILVLLVMGTILFVITQRREPESSSSDSI